MNIDSDNHRNIIHGTRSIVSEIYNIVPVSHFIKLIISGHKRFNIYGELQDNIDFKI